MDLNLEYYVRQAKNGNRQALETVVDLIQGNVFGLALRMLSNPEDAEDETQEILIKIITHLSDFREESAFNSWVYRVACNHLITAQNRKNKNREMTLDHLEAWLSTQTGEVPPLTVTGPERQILIEEARIACLQKILACLEQELRIAYILGDLYGVTSKEGAYILDITPEAFRKRLSRGRKRLQDFMTKHCGLVNEKNSCRCHKAAARKHEQGLISPYTFLLKKEAITGSKAEATAYWKELSELDRMTTMFRQYPEYQSPESFAFIVKGLMESGKYKTLFQ